MQARTQAAVVPAPQAKLPSGVTVYTTEGNQVLQIPTSHDAMMALLARRRQLNDQLEQVTDRRNDLIEQLRTTPTVAEGGLQSQLQVLDQRVLQLESDLATTGREIAGASPELIAMAEERNDPPENNGSFGDGLGAGISSTFAVMAVLFILWRTTWNKAARRNQPRIQSADAEQLQRLEHGMEAMAIEIERISEGQRFVTKLLSESRGVDSVPR